MSVFDTPIGNDPRFMEATVLAVDNIRFVCKVLTQFKQSFDSVPWASNIYDTPVFGDRVRVDYVQGYPVITAILNRTGMPVDYSPNIDDGTPVDTGNYSTLLNGLVQQPEKPQDLVSGDKVVSNSMGGIFGLLKGGTFIARASKLAQIIVSKYDDLVRVVARTFELFTDGSIDINASVRGRVYRFTGYADTLANGRAGTFKYREVYGDTVAGDAVKGNYYGYTPTTFAALPAINDVVRKKYVLGSPNNLFQSELHLTGQHYSIVQNSAGTAYTYIDHTNATFDVKTLNSTYTRITTTPTTVVLTYNGSNIITISPNNIVVNFNNISTVTLDANGITADYNGATKCILNSSDAILTNATNNNYAVVRSTGTELWYNGGVHFVRVDSAGVKIGRAHV